MAINSNFKNANVAGVNNSAWSTVYTAPSGKTSYFIHLNVASTNGGGQVSVRVLDSSVGPSAYTYTVKSAPVPDGSSLIVLSEGNKIVLESGDKIEVKSETAGVVFDVQSSLLEDVNA